MRPHVFLSEYITKKLGQLRKTQGALRNSLVIITESQPERGPDSIRISSRVAEHSTRPVYFDNGALEERGLDSK